MEDTEPKLLCVDDDELVLVSLQRALRNVEVEILTALSGQAGLDILQQTEVAVVISDMRMEPMPGEDFLQQAAQLQPHAKRIVLTGLSDAETTQAAINRGGVSMVLNKPWDDIELKRVVSELLKVAKLERENRLLNEANAIKTVELADLNRELEERVAERTAELNYANELLTTTLEDISNAHTQLVNLVANIAALPNPESDNAESKIRLALALGEELELDDEALGHLRDATRLHRLGWVGVPRAVLDLPLTLMSTRQRKEFEKHPALAQAVLLSVPKLRKASEIIGAQFEHFNGLGFPNKSVGEGIVLGARILAVARDYYDYLSGRILKERLTPGAAVRKMVAQAGEVYDPVIIKMLPATLKRLDDIDPNLDEMGVKVMSLMPGMRLSQDVITREGVVLLAKGAPMTEAVIATLINLERRSDQQLMVYVQKPEGYDENRVAGQPGRSQPVDAAEPQV
ncbi:MAG: response regulator [Pseudomonadales bacterium]